MIKRQFGVILVTPGYTWHAVESHWKTRGKGEKRRGRSGRESLFCQSGPDVQGGKRGSGAEYSVVKKKQNAFVTPKIECSVFFSPFFLASRQPRLRLLLYAFFAVRAFKKIVGAKRRGGRREGQLTFLSAPHELSAPGTFPPSSSYSVSQLLCSPFCPQL